MNTPHLRGWVQGLGRVLGTVVWRFPLVVCAVAAAAGSALWMINHEEHSGQGAFNFAWKILLLAAAGMPWLFALTVCGERWGGRWRFAGLGGLAVIAVFGYLMPADISAQPGAFVFSYVGMLACAHFLATVLPWPEKDSGGFWPWNRALLTRFLESGIYAFILWMGLLLALASVNKLVGLNIDDKGFLDTFVLCAAVFHPLFFLAGIGPARSYENDRSFPTILKVFTQVVLAPLCAVYAVILYIYAIKIVVSRHWPDGWVTAPVIAFSVAGILAWLLLQPLARDSDRWGRWFCTNLPRVLVPLCILMLLAVRVRTQEYGFTEFRVLGVTAGFWLLAFSLFYSFTKSSDLRLVPASLALVAILLSLGPYSAPAIGLRSQTARLNSMLEQILKTPEAAKYELFSEKYQNSLKDTIRYIIETNGVAAMPTPLVERWKKWRTQEKNSKVRLADPSGPGAWSIGDESAWTISDEMCRALGVEGTYPTTSDNDCVCAGLTGTQPIAISGAKELFANLSLSSRGSTEKAGPFIFTLERDGHLSGAVFATGTSVDITAVKAMIQALSPPDTVPNGSHDSTQTPDKLSATFLSGGDTFRFVIIHASGHRTGQTGHRWLAVDSLDFLIIREQATPK